MSKDSKIHVLVNRETDEQATSGPTLPLSPSLPPCRTSTSPSVLPSNKRHVTKVGAAKAHVAPAL